MAVVFLALDGYPPSFTVPDLTSTAGKTIVAHHSLQALYYLRETDRLTISFQQGEPPPSLQRPVSLHSCVQPQGSIQTHANQGGERGGKDTGGFYRCPLHAICFRKQGAFLTRNNPTNATNISPGWQINCLLVTEVC